MNLVDITNDFDDEYTHFFVIEMVEQTFYNLLNYNNLFVYLPNLLPFECINPSKDEQLTEKS